MFKKRKDSSTPSILILATSLILGLLVGFFVLFYLWQLSPGKFLTGLNNRDLNLGSPEYGGASFVIQDPRRVYVSQDIKIDESYNYLSEAVIGVFSKIKPLVEGEDPRYVIEDELFSGITISSDGWVLVNVLGRESFNKNLLNDFSSYVVISRKNKKMYEIENVVYDNTSNLLFLKMEKVSNLPVRNFVNVSDLTSGQTVLAYNFSKEVMINSIREVNSGPLIKFSDDFSNSISLNTNLPESFKNSFLFNLNGDLMALIGADLKVSPIHDFRPYIYNFLKNKELNSFSFGVYYTDLKDVFQANLPFYGALINNNSLPAVLKGSLAEEAGLKEGDIVVKINNYEIDGSNNLNDVLNNFSIGDRITLSYWRDGVIVDARIDLE